MRYAHLLDPYLINNDIIKYIIVCSNVYVVYYTNINFSFIYLNWPVKRFSLFLILPFRPRLT